MKKQTFTYSHRAARKKGCRDGGSFRWKIWQFLKESKLPYPLNNQQQPAQYEEEMYHAAERDISIVSLEWEQLDRKLMSSYCDKLHLRDKAHCELVEKKSELNALTNRYEKVREEFENFEQPLVTGWFKWPILILLGVFEIFVNSEIFSLLGSSDNEKLLLAAGIGAVTTAAAHIMGMGLKQKTKTQTDKILLTVGPLVVLALMYGLAIGRAIYFEDLNAPVETYNEVTHQVEKTRLINADATPTKLTTLFFIINMAVFFVSMLLAYFGSRTNQTEYRKKRKLFLSIEAEFIVEEVGVEEAAEALKKAGSPLIIVRQLRQKEFEAHVENAKEIADTGETLMRTYRTANIEARNDAQTPLCFNVPVKVPQLPGNLDEKTISWNCDNRNG